MGRGGKRHSDKPRNCECAVCGKGLTIFGVGGTPKYCSDDCKVEAELNLRRVNLVCQQCGGLFRSLNPNAKYCSKVCAGRARAKGKRCWINHKKVCPVCGDKFETTVKLQICCSPECGCLYGHEKLKKYYTCQHCGKPFWRENAFRMKYCSTECHKAAIQVRTLERHKDAPLPVIYKRACPECGTEFDTSYPNHVYCSNDCCYIGNLRRQREQWASGYIPRAFICKECGAEVRTVCGFTRSTFCSDVCQERFINRESKQKRQELMKRYFIKHVCFEDIYKRNSGICQICGLPVANDKSSEKMWAATIDHIVPLSLGGTHEPRNCQLAHRLCNSLKLQEADCFCIDWKQMLEQDFERWSAALEEYMKYMDAPR